MWELQNAWIGAIIGVLLMMYAHWAAAQPKPEAKIRYLYFGFLYVCGLALLANLLVYLAR